MQRDPPPIAQPLLVFAHLAFCAAAILARPSALIFLRFGALGVDLEMRDRSGLVADVVSPFNSALAFSSRAISASIVLIISVVSMGKIIAFALGGRDLSRAGRVTFRAMEGSCQ